MAPKQYYRPRKSAFLWPQEVGHFRVPLQELGRYPSHARDTPITVGTIAKVVVLRIVSTSTVLLDEFFTNKQRRASLQELVLFSIMGRMNHVNVDLLLSPEEYLALPEETRRKIPYIYSLENQGQILCYFGSKHVSDPKHPQIEFIHEKWNEFFNKVQNNKAVVIHEGNVNEGSQLSIEQAIEQSSESGAIVYWAKKAQVSCFRPEPTIATEAGELLKEFSKDYIFYFFMMRGIATWLRKIVLGNFDEYIAKNIQRYQKELDWPDFDFSFESAIVNVHKKIFAQEFGLEDSDFIRKIPSPAYKISIINGVAQRSSKIRDVAILKHIGDYWEKGYNIFIVYGGSHAKMQERALRDMIEG